MIELSEPRFFGKALQDLAKNAAAVAPSEQTDNAVHRMLSYSFGINQSNQNTRKKSTESKSPLSESIVRRNAKAFSALCLFVVECQCETDAKSIEAVLDYLLRFLQTIPVSC